MSATDPNILHRVPKAGERLSGLTRQQVYDLLRQKLLEGVRIGDTTFVTDESLRALPGKLTPYRPDSATKPERMAGLKRAATLEA